MWTIYYNMLPRRWLYRSIPYCMFIHIRHCLISRFWSASIATSPHYILTIIITQREVCQLTTYHGLLYYKCCINVQVLTRCDFITVLHSSHF